MTHWEKILNILIGRDWVSNFEIHSKTSILRYPARITEINQNPDKWGYHIESMHGKKGLHYYRAVKIEQFKTDQNGQFIMQGVI